MGPLSIVLAYTLRGERENLGLHMWYMIDTIGICLLLGLFVVPRIPAAWRWRIGVGPYLLSNVVRLVWHPTSGAGLLAYDTLTGPADRSYWQYVFPVLPWFGVYLIGTSLGRSSPSPRDGATARGSRRAWCASAPSG